MHVMSGVDCGEGERAMAMRRKETRKAVLKERKEKELKETEEHGRVYGLPSILWPQALILCTSSYRQTIFQFGSSLLKMLQGRSISLNIVATLDLIQCISGGVCLK